MPDWLVQILVAVVGVAGTLIVAYIGNRQWRAGRGDPTRRENLTLRRRAYRALWKLVEEVHLDVRLDPKEIKRLPKRIAEVNTFVLQNEIYLSEGDHNLVNQYLKALGEMVECSKREETDPSIQESVRLTDVIPRGATAAARAFDLRDQLLARVRSALDEHE